MLYVCENPTVIISKAQNKSTPVRDNDESECIFDQNQTKTVLHSIVLKQRKILIRNCALLWMMCTYSYHKVCLMLDSLFSAQSQPC